MSTIEMRKLLYRRNFNTAINIVRIRILAIEENRRKLIIKYNISVNLWTSNKKHNW